MNNSDKDLMRQLNNLDDSSVEEIAEKYPALSKKVKKRILKQCMKKNFFIQGAGNDSERKIVVSETEHYKRSWYRFAASAAACLIAVAGIISIFMLNGRLAPPEFSEPGKLPVESSHISNTENETNVTTDPNNDISVRFNETNWYKIFGADAVTDNSDIDNSIEFSNDDFSGHYIIPSENLVTGNATKIYFTYTRNENGFVFNIGFDTVTGRLSIDKDQQKIILTLVWQNGNTEHFSTPDITIKQDGSYEYSVKDKSDSESWPGNDSLKFLSETSWYGFKSSDNFIEFGSDGFSGHYGIPANDYVTNDKRIYFVYAHNKDKIYLYKGDDIATVEFSNDDLKKQAVMHLFWENGDEEHFFNSDLYGDKNIQKLQN